MIVIREAGPSDAAALNAALAALSDYLGDTHRATDGAVEAALRGPSAFAGALLAERKGPPVGAILFSPLFSTTSGGAGVFVSDLWVSEAERGGGLGRDLLAHAARAAQARWGAAFISLTVHARNAGAAAFYRRLGFDIAETQAPARLGGRAFDALIGEAR